MHMNRRVLFLIFFALAWALFAPAGWSKSVRDRLVQDAGSEVRDPDAAPDSKNYGIEKFSIELDPPGKEEVRISVEYNNERYYDGTFAAPGDVELTVEADTDFNDPQQPGHSSPERIYLYLRSTNYAAQWHTLRREGRTLKFANDANLTMYRKKYAAIEYEFYQGDDPDFEGRAPTYSGIAAVGHWGRLPGFTHDWQIWQGSVGDGLWGDTLLLEFHRGTDENGMIESTDEYERMTRAPEGGYVHYGGCGAPSVAATAGKSYYCRIVGHTKSTRGYGKIRIRDICEKPPEGMDVLEN